MKILLWSDSPRANTGFGNVTKILCNSLLKKDKTLDITILGINDRGGWYDQKEYPYKIYPAIYNDISDKMGFKRIISIFMGVDPQIEDDFDTLICCLDIFHFTKARYNNVRLIDHLKMMTQKRKKKLKTILYSFIDGDYVPEEWLNTLKFFDHIAVPSHYGKRILENADKTLRDKITVVTQAVDSENFSSFDDLRKPELKKQIGAGGKFVIGVVARNNWRKDLPRAIKIFSEFKKQVPNSFLYVHTNPRGEDLLMCDVYDVAKDMGLRLYQDFVCPSDLSIGIERREMKNVYGCMDVCLSASMAEGLGMPILEAMLCEVINVAPNNTTIPELFNIDHTKLDIEHQLKTGRGLAYDCKTEINFGNMGINAWNRVGSIDDAVEKLLYIYNNQDKIDVITNRALKFAKEFTSDKMSADFIKMI